MFDLRHTGAGAAAICAATYIFGFALLISVLAPLGYGTAEIDAAMVLEFAAQNPTLMSLWNLVIYIVNGLALAVLAVAVSSRFRAVLPGLSKTIFGIGLLWATLVTGAGMIANVGLEAAVARYPSDPEGAILLWEILHTVELGLGGGNEIAGGLWALVIASATLTSGRLPAAHGWLALAVGLSGFGTLLPMLGEAPGAIFGLGYILLFALLAVSLAKSTQS